MLYRSISSFLVNVFAMDIRNIYEHLVAAEWLCFMLWGTVTLFVRLNCKIVGCWSTAFYIASSIQGIPLLGLHSKQGGNALTKLIHSNILSSVL